MIIYLSSVGLEPKDDQKALLIADEIDLKARMSSLPHRSKWPER